MRREIDIQTLHQNLFYDAETGKIYNLHSRGNIKSGKELGTSTGNGYKTLNLLGKTFFFHRVAFAMHNGFWPEMVDHINGDREDNRVVNLRASNKYLNAQNASAKKGARFRGACKRPFGYEVFIRSKGRQIYIGRFKNEIEAAYAYDLASLEHHGEHGRRNFLPLVV